MVICSNTRLDCDRVYQTKVSLYKIVLDYVSMFLNIFPDGSLMYMANDLPDKIHIYDLTKSEHYKSRTEIKHITKRNKTYTRLTTRDSL